MSTSVGSIHYDLGMDTKDFDKQSGKVTGRLKSLSKKFAIAGAASATVFGAAFGKFVIAGGVSRYLNIEDAQAKLKGLGHDAESVSKVMESALNAVKGTAFGLDAAATIAASAVAAGVKSGEELTDYLGLTADAATIAGTSLSEMGSIFNKVQTGQRAYTQELNQLADRGIPIYQWLQEELGLSQEALKEMVSAGELDSATYFKVIEKNIGGAALESGKTTRGAWANMKASMSRVGAAIVEDIMPKIRKSFLDLTVFFDKNSDRIVEAFKKTAQVIGGFKDTLIVLGKTVFNYLQPKLAGLWESIRSDLIPVLQRLWHEVLKPLLPVIGGAMVVALGLAIDAMSLLITIASPLINTLISLKEVVIIGTAAFVAFKAAIMISSLLYATTAAFATMKAGMIGATIAAGGARLAFSGMIATLIGPAGMVLALAAVGGAAVFQVGRAIKAFFDMRKETRAAKNALHGLDRAADQILPSINNAIRRGTMTALEGQGRAIRQYQSINRKVPGMPQFAKGGQPPMDQVSLVGEQGPELFIPHTRGTIVPNDKSMRMLEGGSSSTSTSIYGNINIASNADADNFFRRLNLDQDRLGSGLSALETSGV